MQKLAVFYMRCFETKNGYSDLYFVPRKCNINHFTSQNLDKNLNKWYTIPKSFSELDFILSIPDHAPSFMYLRISKRAPPSANMVIKTNVYLAFQPIIYNSVKSNFKWSARKSKLYNLFTANWVCVWLTNRLFCTDGMLSDTIVFNVSMLSMWWCRNFVVKTLIQK